MMFSRLAFVAALVLAHNVAAQTKLEGQFVQGGLAFGQAAPGASVKLDGRALRVDAEGRFILGFGRDAKTAILEVGAERRELAIAPRTFDIQRIEGLPEAQVTPPPAVQERIRRENVAIAETKVRDTPARWFDQGFVWPAEGRISGVYGSQRILNGQPRAPHYGLDIAGPVGAPVRASTAGVVALADPDLYFTGGTIIIDHGFGLAGVYAHLSRLDVKKGDRVEQGQLIGAIGATGRVTGPHLHWALNWFDVRLDPQLLLPAR